LPAAIRFYRKHGLVDEALYLERHFNNLDFTAEIAEHAEKTGD
jgi:hypothetical protein